MANVGGLNAELTIDAQQAASTLQKMDKMAQAMEMRLSDLADSWRKVGGGAGGAFDTKGPKQQKQAIEENSMSIDNNTKARRAFFREQKLQDRTWRESIGTLTSLTFALGYLTQNETNANSVTKRVTQSLATMFVTSQTTEFGLFALGRAGKSMGGAMGGVLMTLGKFAGPLAMVIGGVAGLVDWMQSANREAEEWRRNGMEGVAKGLATVGGGGQGGLNLLRGAVNNLKAQRDAIEMLRTTREKDLGMDTTPGTAGGMAVGGLAPIAPLNRDVTIEMDAQLKALGENKRLREGEIEDLEKILKAQEAAVRYEEMLNDLTRSTGSEYQKLALEIKDVNRQLETGNLLPVSRQALLDKRKELAVKADRMNMTTLDIETERADNMAMLYDQQRLGADALLSQLKSMLTINMSEKERLSIQKGIASIEEKERNILYDRHETLLKMAEDARQQLVKDKEEITSLGLVGIEDQNKLAIAGEQERYETTKRGIEETHTVAISLDKKRRTLSEEGNALLAANEQAHINATALLQLQKERQVAGQRMDAVNNLGGALSQIGSNFGNDLLSKFGQAMQAAMQIAKMIQAASMPGADSGASSLNIFSSILGFLALDSGGYTGDGPRMKPAGIVHKGEVVFEKPIVDRYRPELLSLRANLSRGYAAGGMVGGGGGIGGLGRGLVVTGRVDIDNGTIALRQWMPEYDRWNRKKTP